MRYYGVDWAVFVLIVTHLWLLGNKKRYAFLFGMAASSFGMCLGYMIESVACVIMNATFIFMHARAYVRWRE